MFHHVAGDRHGLLGIGGERQPRPSEPRCDEQEGPDGPLMNRLGARILGRVLPDAAFLTTSSSAIAAEYGRRYGVDVVSVHNTFPLPAQPPALPKNAARPQGAPLKAYWFGQTIGDGRGLEGFIRGAGAAAVPIALHLRGRSSPEYIRTLRQLASSLGSSVSIVTHDPAPPDRMVQLC